MGDFLAELKRRRVVRAAVVYGLVGFTVVQAASAIMPALGIPPWGLSLAVVLVLLGFPIALVLAWAYDLTPEGVVRTGEVDDGQAKSVRTSWSRWVLPLAFGAAVLTYIVWPPSFGAPGRASGVQPRYLDSLVVIPPTNATGSAEYDQLSVGIADQIINDLLRIPALKVINRYSAEVLAGRGLTAREMADSLGAQHIVTATILLVGDRLQVGVQEIDADTEAVHWSDSFTASAGNLMDAQVIIAQQIIDRLLAGLPRLPRLAPTVDLASGAAQLSHQLGFQWLSQRTRQGVARAIEYFSEAVAHDPGFAQAHASLSQAYTLALNYRYDLGLDGYTMARLALRAADEAVRLDPEGAAGYAARGYIRAMLEAPLFEAVSDFRRAAELQPNSATIASWRARALEMSELFDDALAETRRAADLDPRAAGPQLAVAYIALRLGRYDEAVEFARKGRVLEPELMLARAIEGRALLLRGDADQCVRMDLGEHAALHATCLWEMGDVRAAQAVADSVEAVTATGSGMSGFSHALRLEDLAVYYAWVGDAVRSLALIERAYDVSPTALDIRVYRSALFDRVRNPEFEARVDALRAQLYERSLRAPDGG